MKHLEDLKIALVHDFLLYPGGAEKVLFELARMFPQAPIHTLLYDKEKMGKFFPGREIRTSYLQKWPGFIRRHHRWLWPFYSSAAEVFDFREFDLVISSSGAWTKGIVTRLSTAHVAYLHSPMRSVWDFNERYPQKVRLRCTRFWVRLLANYLRVWDRLAADRPDFLVANSCYTQERIRKYYRRESTVIHPPVEPIALGSPVGVSREKYFLIVSRLSAYKKVGLAVETFNKLGLPLVVVGEGKEKRELHKIAGANVRILGWQNEEKMGRIFAGARALIFPSDDDFGIVMVESLGAGVPVIAFRKGGAEEIIEEGKTGEFFDAQTVEVLADGVRRFIRNEPCYDRERMKEDASRYSPENFRSEFTRFLKEKIERS